MEYFIAKEASQDLDEILDYFLVRNVKAGSNIRERHWLILPRKNLIAR